MSFDLSLNNLACLDTLKSYDETKQFVDVYIFMCMQIWKHICMEHLFFLCVYTTCVYVFVNVCMYRHIPWHIRESPNHINPKDGKSYKENNSYIFKIKKEEIWKKFSIVNFFSLIKAHQMDFKWILVTFFH